MQLGGAAQPEIAPNEAGDGGPARGDVAVHRIGHDRPREIRLDGGERAGRIAVVDGWKVHACHMVRRRYRRNIAASSRCGDQRN